MPENENLKIDSLTLPDSNGNSQTYDIDLPPDNRITKYSPYYVTATGIAAVTSSPYYCSQWNISNNNITSLYDGLTIKFKIPIAGNGSYGTGICLNGNTVGIVVSGNTVQVPDLHPVVYNTNTMIGTRYGVNSTITLTYNATQTGTLYRGNGSETITGVWQLEDYDSTNTQVLRTNYTRKLGPSTGDSTSTKSLYRYQFLIEDKNGLLIPFGFRSNQYSTYTKPLTTAPFNPFSPIYYYNYTTTVTVNSNIPAGYLYEQYLADMRYSFNIKSDGTVGTQALTVNAPVYIKALYNHTTGTATFAPNTSSSNYLEKSSLTQTLPAANPNSSLTNNNTEYIYIQLGNAYDKYRVDLNAFNKVIYHWDSLDNTCKIFTPTSIYGKVNSNLVYAGPNSGTATNPTFRALVEADIPSISASTKVTGLATVATSGSYNDLNNKPSTFTPSSHTHGNITNDGKVTVSESLDNGDAFLFTDNSDSQKIKKVFISNVWSALGGGASGKHADNYYATADSVNGLLAAADAMVFKGIVNSTNSLPTNGYQAGWTYKITEAGTYAGFVCEIGDVIFAIQDGPESGSTVTNAHWHVIQTNIDGAVVGPASLQNGGNELALFDGGSGIAIKRGYANSTTISVTDGKLIIPNSVITGISDTSN